MARGLYIASREAIGAELPVKCYAAILNGADCAQWPQAMETMHWPGVIGEGSYLSRSRQMGRCLPIDRPKS